MILKDKLYKHLDEIVVLIIFCVIFAYITFYCRSDLWSHMQSAIKNMEDGTLMRGNFLLYLLIDILAGFSGDWRITGLALSLVLALSTALRYRLVRDTLKTSETDGKILKLFAFSMLFIYVLPFSYILGPFGFWDTNQMYLPFITPTIWHNSTTLMLFPFAFLLFIMSVKQIDEYSPRRNMWICMLVALNVFIKPSFFFCFCCAYPLMMIYKYHLKSVFWKSMIPVGVGILCLSYVYVSIYESGVDNSSIAFNMDVLSIDFWLNKSIRLLCSIIFPLCYFIFNIKKCVRDAEFYYVLILFLVGMAISYFFIELGPRYGHGNLSWQVHICMWLLYYYVLKNILPTIIVFFKGGKIDAKNIVLLILYSVCLLTGIFYFVKYMITKDYY